MDDKFIRSLVWQQRKHLFIAGVTLIMATSCNLASPVVVGTIVESLAGQLPMEVYQKVWQLPHGHPSIRAPPPPPPPPS